MPVQYYLDEMLPVHCMRIKVPVVVAESDVEVVLDSTLVLPELAQKVDKIIASIRDLKGTPVFVEEEVSGEIAVAQFGGNQEKGYIVKKVVLTGTLHKQIFYVNKNDNVRHTSEDLTFSKLVDLDEPQMVEKRRDVSIDFRNIDIDVNFELQRASRLHQTAVLTLIAKAVEDRQIYVQTCPPPEERPMLRDRSIESWANEFTPVFWGASNVRQTTTAHSGSFAADLGALNTVLPASLFQMVTRGINGGKQYRLSFWVNENVLNTGNFTLNAEVIFFDENGIQIGVGSQTYASAAIPDNAYSQVQFTTPVTDENVASAMVRFSLIPAAGNANTVRIDDVRLEAV
ncbi:MAG: Uncharacterized protein XD97_0127 [Pelotomaculum thermopropionicum]|uniref:SipL SPOCS domain-containing protein n=1 Tax=Pelotomaculum thermopropionicum TaxID=110500 RepID=A0A101HVF1_9FIRM|nr:MAG: Uncharacterized protein XD97_0127 [Pelotomaculum thermopropionicum]